MSTLIWKDEEGNTVREIPIPKEMTAPEDLIDAIQAHRTEPKVKITKQTGKSKKREYKNLRKVSASEDDRRLIFAFQNAECYLNLPDMKMYHAHTNEEFLKTHYDDISEVLEDIVNASADNLEVDIMTFGLADEVMSRKDLPWFVSFFVMLKHIERGRNIPIRLGLLLKKAHFKLDSNDYSGYLPMLYSMEKLAKAGMCINSNVLSCINFKGMNIQEILRVPGWITKWIKDKPVTLRGCLRTLQELTSEEKQSANLAAQYMFEQYDTIPSSYYLNSNIDTIIDEYNYPHRQLVDYVFSSLRNQGLVTTNHNGEINIVDADQGLRTLRDYISMSKDIGITYDRYPRFLTSVHDIVWHNHSIQLTRILNEKYYERSQEGDARRMEYYPPNKQYFISLPETLEEIVEEGKRQAHCVGSYIERVAEGHTNILFMRDNSTPDESLLTLEVSNNYKIIQAKGIHNRNPREEEVEFLKLYTEYLDEVNQARIDTDEQKLKAVG